MLLALFAGAMASSMPGQSAEAQTSHIQESREWQQGHFQNPQRTWSNIPKGLFQGIFGAKVPGTAPNQPVAVLSSHGEAFAAPPSCGLRITWFGHSSALIEVDGSRLLIDPFWGERASPLPWLGPKRWYAPPIPLEKLPAINAVLISHDHYDHLDFSTIRKMRAWQTVFIVPLGIGAQLRKWGIAQNRIVELDWWQATQLGKLKLVATPARHQSGRSLFPARKTLWAGWAILGDRHRVWYSGDTGYFPDLCKIGERLGPFDVTLIEVGHYGKYWPDFHLGPEQAVETNRDVGGRVMIPVHWGLIRLSHHGWTEPVECACCGTLPAGRGAGSLIPAKASSLPSVLLFQPGGQSFPGSPRLSTQLSQQRMATLRIESQCPLASSERFTYLRSMMLISLCPAILLAHAELLGEVSPEPHAEMDRV